jgi:hypothetical protein
LPNPGAKEEMNIITASQVKETPDKFKLVWQPDALPTEKPVEGKQYEFLTAGEDYVGLDGGKGSGKSDLLIFDCIRPEKLSSPRWHGVIFRREYKRLTEVIDRATFWFNKLPQLKAHWQGNQSRFVFPSGGWLAFHNVENLGDEEKYQGWEITDLKFDQLEEFEESMFDFLVLQNRTTDPNLKATIRWTANPGGVGHAWVKRRFVDFKEPGNVYTFTQTARGKEYVLTYRRIFATVFDNPYYRNDSKYIARLFNDPNPHRRKALAEGDWSSVFGQFFSEFSSPVHVIKSKTLPAEWERLTGLDYGNVKTMEFLRVDYEGRVYVEHEFHTEPNEQHPSGLTASEFGEQSAKWMLERGLGENLSVIADTNMWSATGRDVGSNKTPERIVSEIWEAAFKAKDKLPPILFPASKKAREEYRFRIACNSATQDYLHYEADVSGKIGKPARLFFLDRCKSIIQTLPALVVDPNDPNDIKDKQDDHDYDSFKYAFMQLIATDRKAAPRKKEWFEEIAQSNSGNEEEEYSIYNPFKVSGE